MENASGKNARAFVYWRFATLRADLHPITRKSRVSGTPDLHPAPRKPRVSGTPGLRRKEESFLLLSGHLPFQLASSPRDRAGLLPAVPLRGTGFGCGERLLPAI